MYYVYLQKKKSDLTNETRTTKLGAITWYLKHTNN